MEGACFRKKGRGRQGTCGVGMRVPATGLETAVLRLTLLLAPCVLHSPQGRLCWVAVMRGLAVPEAEAEASGTWLASGVRACTWPCSGAPASPAFS